jgi:hypothetical protein
MPTRLRFEANIATGTNAYIDLGREMSKVQRKLVRQGQNFVVHGGLIQDSNNEYTLRFNTAPQSWVVGTALRRAKKMWDLQYAQVLKEGGLGRVKPKYWDWKVYLDADMASAQQLYAKDAAGTSYPGGEWNYSRYASEDVDWSNIGGAANRDADEFYAHIVGDHQGTSANWQSIGIIESWKDSRPKPDEDDPDIPGSGTDIRGDPLVNLFDEADADDERLEHLAQFGDQPPYYGPDVAGDGSTGLERMAMAATSASNPIVSFGGFIAPHGLIQVAATQASGQGSVTILMDVEAVGGIY